MTTRNGPDLEPVVEAMRAQRIDEAVSLLKDIGPAHPDDFPAGWLMLQCLELQHDRAAVVAQMERLCGIAAGRPAELDRLADFAYRHGLALDCVIEACRKQIATRPGDGNALFNLAVYLARDARYEEAIECYREALRCGIPAPEQAELNIASIYMDHLLAPEQARRHIENARRHSPRHPAVYQNLGTLAEQQGDRVLAARAFEKCLELQPGNHAILARLADAHRFSDLQDPVLRRMERAVTTSGSTDLLFALGKAYDRLAEYEAAWRLFDRANERDARHAPPYDPGRIEALFDRIRAVRLDGSSAPSGESSPAPVFICGLFRSGSTLLEKMLGSHSAFRAGGESEFFPRLMARHLPYWPDGLDRVTPEDTARWREEHSRWANRLTGGTRRLLDKRPENFLIIGLIRAILPTAKFIVTERDPRDMAVSIYATRLNPRQNYATRLANIRHYLARHRSLVDHWASTVGDALVRVRYEDLVREPRATLEPVIEWLGESWEDGCLAFNEKRATVRTVSSWQVREPLHDRSIGRWRNYSGPVGEVFGSES